MAPAPPPAVHEAFGPDFTSVETFCALTIGVLSLVVTGLLALLLGALADEHRITTADIGLAAMLEALSTGVFTGLAGLALRPVRLRTIGVVSALLLAACDLLTTQVSGGWLLGLRAAAGAPEGLMLWITVGLIARTATPERWAGVLYTAIAIAQLAFAALFAVYVLPVHHANGGYVALSLAGIAAAAAAFGLPHRFGALPPAAGGGAARPPLRGWIALLGTLLFVAAGAAVGIYILPLAHQAGLSSAVGRYAVSAALLSQVAGGLLATALAGRVGPLTVFAAASLVFLAAWAVFALPAPAWLFIAVGAATGLAALMVGPFLTPMLIAVDPTRSTAMQSGGAQLLGGALGPLLAALVVSDKEVRAVLWLGAVLLLAGLAVIVGAVRGRKDA